LQTPPLAHTIVLHLSLLHDVNVPKAKADKITSAGINMALKGAFISIIMFY
jgi:hypothetical protein